MAIANLKITDEQLNSKMSDLLLEIDHLKKTFEMIGRGFKQGKPVPKRSLESIEVFMEASEDIDVDAARELLETLSEVNELSLPEVRRADEILGKARTILVSRSVTGEGSASRTFSKFLIEWIEKRELPPLPGETLKRTMDEIVEKKGRVTATPARIGGRARHRSSFLAACRGTGQWLPRDAIPPRLHRA